MTTTMTVTKPPAEVSDEIGQAPRLEAGRLPERRLDPLGPRTWREWVDGSSPGHPGGRPALVSNDERDEPDSMTEEDDDLGFVFRDVKPVAPRSWHLKDKLRNRHVLSDLHSSLSVMDPIQEDKEEYDWFEERRQLLEDKQTLLEKIQNLEDEKRRCNAEVREARDQNELLEFRILELEACPVASSRIEAKTMDQGTNPDPSWNLESHWPCAVPRKKSFQPLHPECNEDKLNDLRSKLQSWLDFQKSPLPEGSSVLFQVISFLDTLKQISIWRSKEIQMSKLEDKAKEQIKTIDKLQHAGLSMSTSLDSASEVSDAVSQGGETGYSSDESIDTEELYSLQTNSGDFSSPDTSMDGFPFFYQKPSPDSGPQGLPFLGKSESEELGFDPSSTYDGHWNPAEVLRRLRDLEAEERKTRESLRSQQEKMDQLQVEKDVLNEKCMELEESEHDARLSEQHVHRKLLIAAQTESRLRQRIADLNDRDAGAKKRIGCLEKEKDKLRLEATQLLNLINTCKILPKTVETSEEALRPEENLFQDVRCPSIFLGNERDSLGSSFVLESFVDTEFKTEDGTTVQLCSRCVHSCSLHSLDSAKTCLHHLVEENLRLQRWIGDKETEYVLKMEALKCDREEMEARLEDKVCSAQKHERDMCEQLEAVLQEKEALENHYKAACDEYLLEKAGLLQQIEEFRSRLKVSSATEVVYEDRPAEGPKKKIKELENHLSALCQEVEESTKSFLDDERGKWEEAFLAGCADDNVLEKMHDLARANAQLKQRIFELEKKEKAYKETLQEADKIMADVEKSYKDRIEELESVEEKLRARIVQHEQSEKRLRQTLRNNNRNSEVTKFGELLDRLLETEASEQRLKDRIHSLENKEREQKQYVMRLEKDKTTLESELQDQEELIQTINQMKRTEKDLRLQIEGLETAESALQETLFQADTILAERENKLQGQLDVLEAEMENLQRVNSQLNVSEAELKTTLKEAYSNLEQLRTKLQLTGPFYHCPLEDEDTWNHPVRVQQMADVLETNTQLELQISELEETNCKLRQQVLQLETQRLQSSSDTTANETSNGCDHFLQLNLELLARNSEIECLQDKIKLLETGNAAAELQNCNCCNCVNCRPLLHDIETQVFLLDEIISGSCSPDPQESSEEEESQDVMHSSRNRTEAPNHKKQKTPNENVIAHHNRPSKKAQNNEWMELTKQIQSLQSRMAVLEDDLAQKTMLLEENETQRETLNSKIEEQDVQMNAKITELTNLQNDFKSLQEENQEFKEKARKAETSEKLLKENLARKKQDLNISNKQVQQLEQRLSQAAKQWKCIEQNDNEIANLKQKMQDLETELQKKRESERKIHAENVHLHHKVEAQRERISSLQVVKKDYKHMMSKYDLLEKQKKIVDQAVVPLKNKINQLTQKCKEKDQFISHLTKQHQRKSAAVRSKDRTPDSENDCVQVFDETSVIPLSPDGSSSLSSSCNETSDSSLDSSGDRQKSVALTPRSRIPRYTALTSPVESPRNRPTSLAKSISTDESASDHRRNSDMDKFLTSPRYKSADQRTVSRSPKPSKKTVTYEKQDEVLRPPLHFQVTRQVGTDGLLVAWKPPTTASDRVSDDSCAVSGYQVFVNGVLHQKVRSPDRTKALLNGLDLSECVEISICAVTQDGRLSPRATTEFDLVAISKSPRPTRPIERHDVNQKPLKQKGIVKCNYEPKNVNSSNPFFELRLKTGDLVTVFGEKQANGFFYGEANGQRGLIAAHVFQELPTC